MIKQPIIHAPAHYGGGTAALAPYSDCPQVPFNQETHIGDLIIVMIGMAGGSLSYVNSQGRMLTEQDQTGLVPWSNYFSADNSGHALTTVTFFIRSPWNLQAPTSQFAPGKIKLQPAYDVDWDIHVEMYVLRGDSTLGDGVDADGIWEPIAEVSASIHPFGIQHTMTPAVLAGAPFVHPFRLAVASMVWKTPAQLVHQDDQFDFVTGNRDWSFNTETFTSRSHFATFHMVKNDKQMLFDPFLDQAVDSQLVVNGWWGLSGEFPGNRRVRPLARPSRFVISGSDKG